MKILLIAALFLASCSSESNQKKVYEDSAIYFSKKLAALTDSGLTQNDSTNIMIRGRMKIYEVMRQYYIDKSKQP